MAFWVPTNEEIAIAESLRPGAILQLCSVGAEEKGAKTMCVDSVEIISIHLDTIMGGKNFFLIHVPAKGRSQIGRFLVSKSRYVKVMTNSLN